MTLKMKIKHKILTKKSIRTLKIKIKILAKKFKKKHEIRKKILEGRTLK